MAILWLLRARRRMTAAQLAAELEISLRTVYRYIDALSASGVPVVAEAGPEGGYSLPDQFRTAPLFFEAQELLALSQAGLFARQAGYPYTEAMERALAKVRHSLTPNQVADLAARTAGLTVSGGRRGGPVAPWLPELEQAIAAGATLAMRYWKPDAEGPDQRTVDPYGLLYRSGLWYLSGFCHLRQAVREFRVDRIHGLSRTGAQFTRPAGFQPWDEADQDWIRERLARGPLTQVRVTGEPWAIAALAEHWYLGRCLTARMGREATFQIDPVGLEHAAHHFAGLGPAVRILEPEPLRQRIIQLLQEWIRHHNAKHP